VALILRRRGIERVRPLAGGFRAWRDLGYPMMALIAATELTVSKPNLR
jgi:rhodanese-related sulfurtransferase